LTVEAMKGLN